MDHLTELSELLRIPSVAGDRAAIERAVQWVCTRVEAGGGVVEHRSWGGVPLGVASIPASHQPATAPSVLIYGHVDVQPTGSTDAWSTDPFVPVADGDGWLYARGVADDKGPFYALLRATLDLAAEGRLPANVRVLCDTEEETGGDTALRFLAQDTVALSACVIFDAALQRPGEPVLVLATRGIASMNVRLTVAPNDVHSGLYGGVAPNAAQILMSALGSVTDAAGVPAPELLAGAAEPTADELLSWSSLDVAQTLSAAGVNSPVEGLAALRRIWCEAAVDVHGFRAGIVDRELNIVPATADAVLSIRVAPGQDVGAVGKALESLLRRALPGGLEFEITPGSRTAPAGPFDPRDPVIAAARAALARAFGVPTVLVRSGGSLPILSALGERGVTTALSGLALPDSHIHGVDERLRIDHLERGIHAARELLLAWNPTTLAQLPPSTASTFMRSDLPPGI